MTKVLMFGATGGCGNQTLLRLLEDGVHVTVIVRDESRLSLPVQGHKNLTVVVAPDGHLGMPLGQYIIGCDAVISTLGHNLTFSGICGPPKRLCSDTTQKVCAVIRDLEPEVPIKFIFISTEGVDSPDGTDPKRSICERITLCLLWLLLPPHADNMAVLDVIQSEVSGDRNPYVEFCAVRPSDLIHGELTPGGFSVHENLQNGIFNGTRPSTRANVGRFMANLVTKPEVWEQWKNKFPHLLDCHVAEGEVEMKMDKEYDHV